jgi:hypothetical protein
LLIRLTGELDRNHGFARPSLAAAAEAASPARDEAPVEAEGKLFLPANP